MTANERKFKEVESFFYTTNTPHEWSSGARLHYRNKENQLIASLEEAKELALSEQVGVYGLAGHVQVSWGVEVKLIPDVSA